MAAVIRSRGAGTAGAPPLRHADHNPRHDDRGSQALEVALVLPLVVGLFLLVVCAARLGVDVVVTTALAHAVARSAAVDGDAAARELAQRAGATVHITPEQDRRHAGDPVRVDILRPSAAFAPLGLPVDPAVPASATARVEHP